MSLQFKWSKTSKTHRIVSEKPCCNIFCIPVHLKSAIKLLNFIKKTLQYSYTANMSLQSRLTVVSREAKKKQHACASSGPRDHYSELFTRMAALKF